MSSMSSSQWGLKVSENCRFLQSTNGQPFFMLADTAWMMFQKLSLEETETYFKNRSKNEFNAVLVVVVHGVDDTNASNVPALIDGDISKTILEAETNSTYDSGYWDHIDKVIDLAAKYDIYIGLVTAWGNMVKKGHLNEANAQSYANWLLEKYADKPNIFWVLGGDIRGDINPEVWDIMGAQIKQNDKEHLVTYHPFGRTQSSTWFNDRQWLDFNMFQSGHRRYDQVVQNAQKVAATVWVNNNEEGDADIDIGPDNWKYVVSDYEKTPAKPTMDGEPSYESIPQGLHDPTQPYWDEHDARRYAYWSVFAGSCGHVYGHNALIQMYMPNGVAGNYGVREYWYDAINAVGASQMRHLKNLMLEVDYFDGVLDQAIIADDNGEKYDRVLANRGKNYVLVYMYITRLIKIKLGSTNSDKVKVWWFNPQNGEKTYLGVYINDGVQQFKPSENEKFKDSVLIIQDA